MCGVALFVTMTCRTCRTCRTCGVGVSAKLQNGVRKNYAWYDARRFGGIARVHSILVLSTKGHVWEHTWMTIHMKSNTVNNISTTHQCKLLKRLMLRRLWRSGMTVRRKLRHWEIAGGTGAKRWKCAEDLRYVGILSPHSGAWTISYYNRSHFLIRQLIILLGNNFNNQHIMYKFSKNSSCKFLHTHFLPHENFCTTIKLQNRKSFWLSSRSENWGWEICVYFLKQKWNWYM